MDKLHGVVVDPSFLTDAEHRHDVRVVEPGRRLRFTSEAFPLFFADEGMRRKDLESYPAAERRLGRLVDDAHTAAADLSEDAVFADLLRHLRWRFGLRRARPFIGAQAFHQEHGGEGLADCLGKFWILVGVFSHLRALTAAMALEELLSDFVDPIPLLCPAQSFRTVHDSPGPPGIVARMCLIFISARK